VRLAYFVLILVLVSAAVAGAQQNAAPEAEPVPRLVQFSGVLRDGAGRTVTGAANVTFAIYAEQEGGAAIWSETQNVLADANGHYSAVLGAATAGGFPAELFGTGESRWLGVAVARQAEVPRALLASVPYALKAGDAQTLGGLPASSYVTTEQLAARTTATPSTTIFAGGASAAEVAPAATPAEASAGMASGGDGAEASSQSVTQLSGAGTAQYLPLWTSSSALGTSKIYQAKGGFVGINTDTPLLQLDVNGNSIFRGSFQMAPQGTATATASQPSHSFQWQASLYDSTKKAAVNEAYGFRTTPITNNVSGPTSRLDLYYGPGGGTLTDTGLEFDSNGIIYFAPGQNFAGEYESLTGSLAVGGGVSINDGAKVTGDSFYTGSLNLTSSEAEGITAQSTYFNGIGIYAHDEGTSGFGGDLEGGYVGVYAKGPGYAAQLNGDVEVIGNLSKSGGSFKIDDPIDPAGKYLSHSFVESPDMMNVYNGNVVTDANGLATIQLPEWFDSLNRDFRYQLTSIGQHSDAWVETEIANNQFTIRTEKPGVKVSWQVTGIRQDAWANAHRIPVEQEKPAAEKGLYLHPELFGHAGEDGIGSMRPGPDGKLVPMHTQAEAH
jgi:hypothetical protein